MKSIIFAGFLWVLAAAMFFAVAFRSERGKLSVPDVYIGMVTGAVFAELSRGRAKQ